MPKANVTSLLWSTTLLFFCYLPVAGQSVLTKKQRYDSLVQEGYRLQYAFFNLSDTDRVVDIGTGAGYNLSRIASHFPSTHFTAEDIDSIYCNKALFVERAKKNGWQPNMNNIIFHIGSDTSTTLPSAAFSKVLAIDAIHEMTYKPAMLADIKRILKPGGSLLISEIINFKKRKKAKTCSYPFLTEPELKEVLTANGLQIVREQLMINNLKTTYVKLFDCRFTE